MGHPGVFESINYATLNDIVTIIHCTVWYIFEAII